MMMEEERELEKGEEKVETEIHGIKCGSRRGGGKDADLSWHTPELAKFTVLGRENIQHI